jgi:hypothetical protein
MPRGNAMEIKVMDDQLILSGPVVASDFDAVESGLTAQPQIKDFCIGRTSDNLCSTLDPGMAA